MRCSFCGANAEKLITSPDPNPSTRACICLACIDRCSRLIAAGAEPSGGARCTFCLVARKGVRLAFSRGTPPRAAICDECLAVCRSILEDDMAPEGG